MNLSEFLEVFVTIVKGTAQQQFECMLHVVVVVVVVVVIVVVVAIVVVAVAVVDAFVVNST